MSFCSKATHRGCRGQTFPFWVFSIITSLTLSLFIANYANMIRWHMRAQNAADAAALAAVAGEATFLNQRTIAQYVVTLDEYRLRTMMYSITNAANGVGASTVPSAPGAITQTCDPDPTVTAVGYDCNNAYSQQASYWGWAMGSYLTSLQYYATLLQNPAPAQNPLTPVAGEAPVPTAPFGSAAPIAFSFAQSHQYCWDQVNADTQSANVGSMGRPNASAFDCGFFYNADLSNTGANTSEIADVVACRKVSLFSPGFFLSRLLPQFQAVGRAAATLMPITESFNPGTAINPKTGAAYSPLESCAPGNWPNGGGPCSDTAGWMPSPSYEVDFSGLNITGTFYVPVLTTPLASPNWTLSCQQG